MYRNCRKNESLDGIEKGVCGIFRIGRERERSLRLWSGRYDFWVWIVLWEWKVGGLGFYRRGNIRVHMALVKL